MIVTELFARLGLDIEKDTFEKGEALLHGLGENAAAIAAGFIAAGAAVAGAIFETAKHTEEMRRNAEIAGVSTEEMEKFAYATSTVGVKGDDATRTLVHLAQTIDQARREGGPAALAMQNLGVHFRNVGYDGRTVIDVIKDIADRLHKAPKGFNATAHAAEILGVRHTQLIPLLRQGGAAIQDLMDEAEELGLVMDEKTVKASQSLILTSNRLWAIIEGLGKQVFGPFIEDLDKVGRSILGWVRAHKELIKSGLTKTVKAIATVSGFLFGILKGTAKVIGWLIDHWPVLAVILGSVLLTSLVGVVGELWTLVNVLWIIGPLFISTGLKAAGAWAAANWEVFGLFILFAGLILLAQDFYTWLEGGDSLFGELGKKWADWLDNLDKSKPTDDYWTAWAKGFFRALFDMDGWWAEFVKRHPALNVFDIQGAAESLRDSDWHSLHPEAYDLKNMNGYMGQYFDEEGRPQNSNYVTAPSADPATGQGPVRAFNPNYTANITVNAPAGDAHAIASTVRKEMDNWHSTKLREADAALP